MEYFVIVTIGYILYTLYIIYNLKYVKYENIVYLTALTCISILITYLWIKLYNRLCFKNSYC